MTENIDVKKIMKSIRDKSTQKTESTINDEILPHKPLQSILEEKVHLRIKHKHYDRNKKNMHVSLEKLDFDLSPLKHQLHKANNSVAINQINPINSNRNVLVRRLALKTRHIIQDEIRFTLDPIIQNQKEFNSHSVNSLNQIFSFINKINQILPEFQKNLEELSRCVDELNSKINSNKSNIDELNSKINSNKSNIDELNSKIDSNITYDLINTEIMRLYNQFFKFSFWLPSQLFLCFTVISF